MEKKLILQALESFSESFPEEALQAAIDQYEEIKPDLLEMLKQSTKTEWWADGTNMYYGHMYAIFILAQFKETEAYPILVEAVSQGTIDELEPVFGEFLTEDLSRALASVCGGDDTLIKQLVEDASVDGFVRGAALSSLVVLLANNVVSRHYLIDYLNYLMDTLERKPGMVWNGLFSVASDIYPGELYDRLQQVWDEGLVDPRMINMSDVDQARKRGKETILEELQSGRAWTYISNSIDEMQRWACFERPQYASTMTSRRSNTTIVRSKPKIGRNQPCPCGSGRKYKKCCG